MQKYKYILFDLDGTVTESGPGIMNAASIALKSFGIEEKDISKLRLFVGPPLDKSFMERYGFTKEDAWKAIAVFREYYNDRGVFENSVYPGIEDMLKDLRSRGFITAIASSKPQPQVDKVLNHFHIAELFDTAVGCELDGTRSNKKEVIAEVLRRLSALDSAYSRDKVIMVGDRCYDIEGAHAMSLPCIGVLYGYGSRQEHEDAGADFIADTVSDLHSLICLASSKE